MIKYGFLRETEKLDIKVGIDKITGLPMTGLLTYLNVIFSEIDDWVHDKIIPKELTNNVLTRKRPDYRSEKLKMIVEFDGIQHYTSPDIILNDEKNTKFYESLGYKVVRIPYFIQLTNETVKILFNKDIKEPLFPNNIASLSYTCRNTPAYLCLMGIERMKKELNKFPLQKKVNIEYLIKENNLQLTRVDLIQ